MMKEKKEGTGWIRKKRVQNLKNGEEKKKFKVRGDKWKTK